LQKCLAPTRITPPGLTASGTGVNITICACRQTYSPRFDELFLSVTGRMLPAEVNLYLGEIAQVRFVPSGHVGPYVAFFRDGDLLTVFYNCRAALLEERQASERVRHLYPLLKALADETRLQILLLLREWETYAQEIVERLGLSQPEGGARYYLPNREAWRQLREELGELLT